MENAPTGDVWTRIDGKVGRITLNRPKALNALTYGMGEAISAALDAWVDDDRVAMVLIDGAGERAFCAGADIAAFYRQGQAGDFVSSRRFFGDEYRRNVSIRRYPKPYVALMDGIVMGGGVGLSSHGSHRIVTERTLLAMPECAIGLVPDIGASLLFSQAPGRIGAYLGLTGARIGPADAIYAGFADVMVPSARLPDLTAALVAEGDPERIGDFVTAEEEPVLAGRRNAIDAAFAGYDAVAIVKRLEASGTDFARDTAEAVRRGSPLSVAATIAILEDVSVDPSLEAAVCAEYRFTARALSDGEFMEGIRAAVIDKDRTPRWSPRRLEDIPTDRVAAMLADSPEVRLPL
ncbi:enoyl-CoA hydratase/isomerase family protein [Consotaella aegiceratis]|uniref:enoyl-CoA hydratase/isomerase family protein n=1 Tax=Consotaella aegiceratis TaxID=3097961 RepID=UPI002F4018AE